MEKCIRRTINLTNGNLSSQAATHNIIHNIIMWNKTAEIAEKHLQKGKEIAIEGKLTNRSWEDKDGNKRFVTEILANELLMLSKYNLTTYILKSRIRSGLFCFKFKINTLLL